MFGQDEVALYVPDDGHVEPPAQRWDVSHFSAIDDRVRGGKSTSHVAITKHGELHFSGHLDITALGAAGFASQANHHPLAVSLVKDRFQGLRLRIRKRPPIPLPPSAPLAEREQLKPTPANVTRYVFNIKTHLPATRPDARRESQLVWQWQVQLPCDDARASDADKDTEYCTFDAKWSDFKPFYRGRPAENPGEFRPERTKEWSIMARSDFGKQAGDFSLHIHSLSAIVRCPSTEASPDPSKRSLDALLDVEKSTLSASSSSARDAVAPARLSSSGEYYGFALFIFATLLYLVWIAWALTPDWALQKIGLAWYPNREWAYLLPAWSLVALLAIYAGFISLNLYNTPDLEDLPGVVDTHANILTVPLHPAASHPLEGHTVYSTGGTSGPLSNDVYDIPPGMVSRELYLFSRSSSPSSIVESQ